MSNGKCGVGYGEIHAASHFKLQKLPKRFPVVVLPPPPPLVVCWMHCFRLPCPCICKCVALSIHAFRHYKLLLLALLAGQHTCDSQVTGSSSGWVPLCMALGKLLVPVCLCHQAVLVRPSGRGTVHSRPHKIFLHFHDLWTLLNKIRECVALSPLSILHKTH